MQELWPDTVYDGTCSQLHQNVNKMRLIVKNGQCLNSNYDLRMVKVTESLMCYEVHFLYETNCQLVLDKPKNVSAAYSQTTETSNCVNVMKSN